ncbi:MAG: hypothetical protein LC785_14105 [Acidobacteria bacterium]|nr:hypothetical protein [Acidobacteriota bacterium]MCA1643047.1 hypothetical protein [Acidobacteriota bacterium]
MNYFNYFTEIEDAFIRRRGKHLLLSPMDWALIESWKSMGVPLHVALRGVEKSFDSYEAKPRRRSVKSLLYCQEEVEAQFAEWRDRQTGAHADAGDAAAGDGAAANGGGGAKSKGKGGGGESEGDGLPFPREAIAAHLASSRAETLSAREARLAKDGEDELTETLARAADRLEGLERDFAAAARPDAELLEGALCDLEAMLDRAARSAVEPARIEARRREAEEQLKPYRARMERGVYEQTRDNLIAKYLREECGVPRLSLFYL